MSLSRRELIGLSAGSIAGGLLSVGHLNASQDTALAKLSDKQYGGSDLAGWTTIVGDGIYAAPGESPVTEQDIETIHNRTYSELRANLLERRIMAHNLSFHRINDPAAFDFVHTAGYRFRLPSELFSPSLEAQTLEGGLAVWDGAQSRLDYHVFFQWRLNRYDDVYKEVATWTVTDDGSWQPVGYLEPDDQWHDFQVIVDFSRKTAALTIDGVPLPTCIAGTPKPASWGSEISARLHAEIISIYPGPAGEGKLHKAHFKDWYWQWQSSDACRVHLPMVANP